MHNPLTTVENKIDNISIDLTHLSQGQEFLSGQYHRGR